MSRPVEDILFGAPSPQAKLTTRVMSAILAIVLLLLAGGVALQFHSAGQLEASFWEFFAWPTTWAFLAKGLLGTHARLDQHTCEISASGQVIGNTTQ